MCQEVSNWLGSVGSNPKEYPIYKDGWNKKVDPFTIDPSTSGTRDIQVVAAFKTLRKKMMNPTWGFSDHDAHGLQKLVGWFSKPFGVVTTLIYPIYK